MKNKPTTKILKIQYIYNTLRRHACAFFPNAIQTSEKRISHPFFYIYIYFSFSFSFSFNWGYTFRLVLSI